PSSSSSLSPTTTRSASKSQTSTALTPASTVELIFSFSSDFVMIDTHIDSMHRITTADSLIPTRPHTALSNLSRSADRITFGTTASIDSLNAHTRTCSLSDATCSNSTYIGRNMYQPSATRPICPQTTNNHSLSAPPALPSAFKPPTIESFTALLRFSLFSGSTNVASTCPANLPNSPLSPPTSPNRRSTHSPPHASRPTTPWHLARYSADNTAARTNASAPPSHTNQKNLSTPPSANIDLAIPLTASTRPLSTATTLHSPPLPACRPQHATSTPPTPPPLSRKTPLPTRSSTRTPPPTPPSGVQGTPPPTPNPHTTNPRTPQPPNLSNARPHLPLAASPNSRRPHAQITLRHTSQGTPDPAYASSTPPNASSTSPLDSPGATRALLQYSSTRSSNAPRYPTGTRNDPSSTAPAPLIASDNALSE
ncbi:mucin-2-like, partial [Schistocerca gregaria]|uniref:mucin-2-like n=1 Tax=Schistocerca gregaria TaxID=7010 RepID=UPI00211E2B8C